MLMEGVVNFFLNRRVCRYADGRKTVVNRRQRNVAGGIWGLLSGFLFVR